MTLTDIMENTIHDEDFGYYDAILHHEEGVDLIPSNIELSGMEMNLVNAMSREFTLRSGLFCPARSTHKKTNTTEINADVPIICRIQQKTPAPPSIPRQSRIMNAGRKTAGGKGVLCDDNTAKHLVYLSNLILAICGII